MVCVHNSSHIIGRCLRALQLAKRIILVDACSSDNTSAVAKSNHPNVEVVTLKEDRGLAHATNIGFSMVETEFTLNINPDALIEKGCVEQLVATSLENPNSGGVAPLLRNNRGNIELDAMFATEIEHAKINKNPEGRFCTWFITGAVVLWKTKAYRFVDGMDERFFLYNEDCDLCIRMSNAGYSLILDPSATAVHSGGASEKITLRTRARKDWNMTWGHLFFQRKYRSASFSKKLAYKYLKTSSIEILLGTLLLRPKKVLGNSAKLLAAWSFLNRRKPWGKNNLSWPEDWED